MRSKERGSVVGFVLGGILLLGLLVGGIMLYKNNITKIVGGNAGNTQVANNDTTKQNDQTTTDTQAAQNEAALKQQQEAEKKAQEQNKAANSGSTSTPAATAQDTTQVPHTATAPSQALPTTGPTEDAILAAVGLSTVIGATMAYCRSRAAL